MKQTVVRFFTDFVIEGEHSEPSEYLSQAVQDLLHDMLQNGYPFSVYNIEIVDVEEL